MSERYLRRARLLCCDIIRSCCCAMSRRRGEFPSTLNISGRTKSTGEVRMINSIKSVSVFPQRFQLGCSAHGDGAAEIMFGAQLQPADRVRSQSGGFDQPLRQHGSHSIIFIYLVTNILSRSINFRLLRRRRSLERISVRRYENQRSSQRSTERAKPPLDRATAAVSTLSSAPSESHSKLK